MDRTKGIFQDGFSDWHEDFGLTGVYLSTQLVGVNEGFDGPVTLCLDVPEELFAKYEAVEDQQDVATFRQTIVPAAELNRFGKPQVYDHFYTGATRRDLVKNAERGRSTGKGTRWPRRCRTRSRSSIRSAGGRRWGCRKLTGSSPQRGRLWLYKRRAKKK